MIVACACFIVCGSARGGGGVSECATVLVHLQPLPLLLPLRGEWVSMSLQDLLERALFVLLIW